MTDDVEARVERYPSGRKKWRRTRVMQPDERGRMFRRDGSRWVWTADEYDEVEQYIKDGMGATEIAMLLDPPSTAVAVTCALRRAGIRLRWGQGRPPKYITVMREEYVKRVLDERYARERKHAHGCLSVA